MFLKNGVDLGATKTGLAPDLIFHAKFEEYLQLNDTSLETVDQIAFHAAPTVHTSEHLIYNSSTGELSANSSKINGGILETIDHNLHFNNRILTPPHVFVNGRTNITKCFHPDPSNVASKQSTNFAFDSDNTRCSFRKDDAAVAHISTTTFHKKCAIMCDSTTVINASNANSIYLCLTTDTANTTETDVANIVNITNTDTFYMKINKDNIKFAKDDGSLTAASPTIAWSVDNRYYIVYDGTTVYFFINGRQIGTITYDIGASKFYGRILLVGPADTNFTSYFDFESTVDLNSYLVPPSNTLELIDTTSTSYQLLPIYCHAVAMTPGKYKITIKYDWNTTGSYVRKKGRIIKSTKSQLIAVGTGTAVYDFGSSSVYAYGTNTGNGVYMPAQIVFSEYLAAFDKIHMEVLTGNATYPLRIKNLHIALEHTDHSYPGDFVIAGS